ncbi:MAG: hypothetical protein HUU23_18090 [Caldilineales bacterium]|nr:hypothetical protein [Caldilineales bacterium]
MFDSAMISKIQKAKHYATERSRMKFRSFSVVFAGNHSDHTVEYTEGRWHCTCEFFAHRGVCSHTMAMERVLEGMVSPAEIEETPIPA